MTTRTVEVFSAGCTVCEETLRMIEEIACSSCEIQVLDMNDSVVAKRAKQLGVTAVPAVVIDGELLECCEGNGPDETTLREAGLGQAV